MAGAGIIKELFVALGFQTDEQSLQKFNDGIQNATKRAGLMALAVTGVAATIGAGIVKVAEASEALGYLSQKSGASVASLEMLSYVSEQFGVSAESARASAEGLGKFLKSLPGAEGFLRSVGVSTRDANGKLRDTGEMLFDLGDKIKNMPRWRQEAILGRVGVSSDMIRVLTQDVGGLKDAFSKMYAVAGVDAQQAAASSREFMNELRTLKTLAGMLARAISLTFIDKMRKDMARFRQTIVENFDKIAKVFKFIIDLVMRVAGFFGAMAVRVIKWLGKILDWFEKLAPSTQKLIAGITGLAAAWKLLNLGFLASPIGIIFALGMAIAALIDDFQTWDEGGYSLIDWSKWEPEIRAALAAMDEIMAVLKDAGAAFMEFAAPIGKMLAPLLKDVLVTSLQNVLKLVQLVAKVFRGDFTGALETAKDMVQHLIDIAQKLLSVLGQVWKHVTGGKIGDQLKAAGSNIAGFFGFGGDDKTSAAPASLPTLPTGPALIPSPAQATQLAASHEVTLNQQTTINVNGSQDPQATGSAIAKEQRGVNTDMQRNTQGAAR